jgi:hypothetical protein
MTYAGLQSAHNNYVHGIYALFKAFFIKHHFVSNVFTKQKNVIRGLNELHVITYTVFTFTHVNLLYYAQRIHTRHSAYVLYVTSGKFHYICNNKASSRGISLYNSF